MTDSVTIVLIVGVVVVIVLIVFRKQLSSFVLRAGGKGLEAEIKTREATHALDSAAGPASRSGGVSVVGVRMSGKHHKVAVERGEVEINDIWQRGEGHEITVGPERAPGDRRE